MKVMVTGATGFIGKALTKRLIEKGYEVVVLSRNVPKAQGIFTGLKIIIAKWDAKTPQGWAHLADGAFAIINLAGESVMGLWTQNKKHAILQSRLDATAAIIAAIREAKAKPNVLIQGSGICYPPDTSQPCDESSDYGSSFLMQGTKQFEEATSEVEQLGTRLVTIRTGFVLGRGGGMLEPAIKSFKFFLGGYFGGGRQWLSWISLADEVEAIIFLMEHQNLSGIFNLVAPHPVIMQDYCHILAKILHRPCLFAIPPSLARIAMGQLADELLLSGQNAAPKRLLEAGYVFRNSDIEQALREILGGT
jgi:uncharacterized protein